MIQAARQVAEDVKLAPGVTDAQIDDWGRFGNFSLFIYLQEGPGVNLRAIRKFLVAAVRKHKGLGAHLRSVIMPKRVYSRWGRECIFDGWSNDGRPRTGRGEISVSLDFIEYSPATNSFPAVQPDGPFEFGAWGKPAYAGIPQPVIS